MFNVLAVNGSPRRDRGTTAMILNPFLDGLAQAGAVFELFYTSRLRIHPCTCGEMRCWYTHSGECSMRDDMGMLYPKLKAAELLVLATPVYVPLPGNMQNFINRLCPLIYPRLERRDGCTRARFHQDVRIKKIVLVSTGGWWEKENFDTVIRIASEVAEVASVEFSGAIIRPHAFLMRQEGEITEQGQAILEQVRQTGQELGSLGIMRRETLEAISKPLISEEGLRRRYNQMLG